MQSERVSVLSAIIAATVIIIVIIVATCHVALYVFTEAEGERKGRKNTTQR